MYVLCVSKTLNDDSGSSQQLSCNRFLVQSALRPLSAPTSGPGLEKTPYHRRNDHPLHLERSGVKWRIGSMDANQV